MSADPAEESLGHYLTRRLVAEKGFVRGHVPEAAELAAAVDEVLTLDNGTGCVMLALVDHDRRDGATSRNFPLSQADLVRIGKACLQYAPTFNGVKLPVGIQLWHVNAPASPARREALAALQRSPGLDKVSVTGFVLDPAAPTPPERVWTTLPWYQTSHPGPRWLRGVLSSPRRSADELARDLGVPAGDPAVQRPALTYAIIAALTALFGVELAARPVGASGFSPDITTLVSLGGLNRDLVTDGGEWWRLLTAACLHGSPIHLLMNGVALYMAGVVLEHLLGRAWLGALFVVGALGGSLMGVHRTWLDPHRSTKAPVAYPRRAMGHLLGHGVRFGLADEVMAFGEGVETMLTLREIAPALPLIAGLSAAHLAALEFPAPLRRLYVARERDAAGRAAFAALAERAVQLGIDILPLDPALDDLNSDLMQIGRSQLAASIAPQMHVVDAERMLDAA